ncbi:hypothetical protein LCGC14_2474730 [marine sediment metagenome]|uniref:Alpha-galactosidase NEW3 domain-containing protein n=1 Tax=marine sediment metagenome TaxID=412755 RepID=A0A0F9BX80_9ZZZZ
MDINKKLLVSFLAFVSVLFLAVTVSAASPLATNLDVEVDGIDWNNDPAIMVGDTVSVRVEFTSLENASDITVEVEIEGDRKDVEAETRLFDVEDGNSYVKTLRLEIPFDLKDELSDFVTLSVDISGSGFKTTAFRELRVQRESFNADIKSIGVPQTVKAGETFPVDVVLKNLGYNDLDDLFVTARISALDIERTAFFGDLVALECDDDDSAVDNYGVEITRKCNEDDDDTVFGRLFLTVPHDVKSGVYALEVEVENEDTTSSEVVQIVIDNAFSAGTFIVSGNQLLIVNPTNDVVVYRLVPESTSAVSVSVSQSLVAVSAGSSETVTVDATSNVAGTQTYSVNIFSADGTLVDTVSFSVVAEGRNATSPIFVLTIILAIIFIVLLVVLIVLIGKKPEKAEEFGESYY